MRAREIIIKLIRENKISDEEASILLDETDIKNKCPYGYCLWNNTTYTYQVNTAGLSADPNIKWFKTSDNTSNIK